jgi:hypothetical protein
LLQVYCSWPVSCCSVSYSYLRDFAPGKEQWIAEYAVGKHFESRLAHVHGNLFAFLNIVVGYLLLRLPVHKATNKGISWLALAGMLMPFGILAEVLLGAPPLFVLIGGISMVVAISWLGVAVAQMTSWSEKGENAEI